MMRERKRINDTLGSPMVIEVAGERFRFTDCWKFAEIGNVPAGITDHVMKTLDGRFFRLTVVDEAEIPSAYGVTRGWYTANLIEPARALEIRKSWAVLREQPSDPIGPWK